MLIVDSDPGVDDALALFVVLAERAPEVLALGSVHGNVSAAVATGNILRILDVLDAPDIPVATGADHPFSVVEATFPALHVHGADGLGGFAGRASQRKTAGESAAQQLVRLARRHPGEITLLALGPLTNVALALELAPELPGLLAEVVWCGGAVDVPGNVTPYAEANARNDPEAAKLVLTAGFELRMVPLDVTAGAWAGETWLQAIAEFDTPQARAAGDWIEHYAAFYSELRGDIGCVLYDPLAVAIALDPRIATYQDKPIDVQLTGLSRGATLLGSGAPAVRIAMTADVDAMLDRTHQALRTQKGSSRF